MTDGLTAAADDTTRPVITDVKLARSLAESRGYGTTRRQRTLLAATRLEPGRPSDDSCLAVMQSMRPSSTFTHVPLSVSILFVCLSCFPVELIVKGSLALKSRQGIFQDFEHGGVNQPLRFLPYIY